MPTKPNHQKLIVPGKNFHPSKQNYGQDMRTIEQWANEGIVRKLIAGSGITLDPINGVDMGNGIEISSSGGGGSAVSVGTLVTNLMPDEFTLPGLFVNLGAFGPISPSGDIGEEDWQLIASGATGVHQHGQKIMIGTGWFTDVGAGTSVAILPQFAAPLMTGPLPGLNIVVIMAASDALFGNSLLYQSNNINLASGATYQLLDTDFNLLDSSGTDLVLTAGSGFSGNGLVSQGGGIYWAGISAQVSWVSDTVFT
jgi:hypothetical protein